jgi:hypothetical protein
MMKVSRNNALSRNELPDCAFDSAIIVIGCENEAGLVFCREAEHRGAHGVLLLSSSEKQRRQSATGSYLSRVCRPFGGERSSERGRCPGRRYAHSTLRCG